MPPRRAGLVDTLVVAAFAGIAIAVWLGFAEFEYTAHHAFAGVALLVCLVAALHAAARLAASLHALLGLAGSLALGAAIAWHAREQIRVPTTVVGFASTAGALALAHFAAIRLAGKASRRAALAGVAAGVVGVVAIVAGALGDATMRWHLLRHLTIVGTPAYYAALPPVAELGDRAWARMRAPRDAAGPRPDYRLEPAFGPDVPLPAADARSPNIVVLLVDTLRADSLAAYGGDPGLMPRTNALAEESIVFTDVRANTSWTRPSVASYFTGKLQESHGATAVELGLRDDEVTLAERLDGAGYATAAFVTNRRMVSPEAGFAQGFDDFVELVGPPGRYLQAKGVNARVLDYLEGRSDASAPFFFYLHYLDPHYPYLSGGEQSFVRRLDRDLYDHELRYLDGHLTRFVGEVRARLSRPTVFLLVADHGEEFGEHESIGHGTSLYREQVDVPAVLSMPGAAPGLLPARLEGRDLHDLLLSIARDPELDVRGWSERASRPLRYYSLYPAESQSWHRPYYEGALRAVDSEQNLLVWSAYGDVVELYDERADPGQTRNIYAEGAAELAPLLAVLDLPMVADAPSAPVELDDEARAQLRALGYLE